jgi:acyl carrier protein
MEELKTIIQEKIAEVAFKRVGFDESLIQSKLLDSITVVDLIVSIEEVSGKRIPQHLINEENFETINTILATLQKI